MRLRPDNMSVDVQNVRYPFCIVWTPIPLLTWLFPFIGHMGIAYSNGVIRDFAGPYHVSVSNWLRLSQLTDITAMNAAGRCDGFWKAHSLPSA